MSAQRKIIISPSCPLVAKVKHHASYVDIFFSAFPTWDENKGKLIVRDIRHHNIVRGVLILQFIVILLQLYCTITKAANYLEVVEGIGITSLFVGGWLTRAEFYPDFDQIPLLNFICWLTYVR